MNIALMANHLNTGGVTRYLLTLSKGLIAKGHRVYVIAYSGDAQSEFERLGVVVRLMPFRTKSILHFGLITELPRLIDFIRRERIDVMHAQTRVMQCVAAMISRATQCPYVSTCHGFFKVQVWRRLWPCWGQRVIAVSAAVVGHLVNDFKVNEREVVLVFNGIDTQSFRPVNAQMRQNARREFNINPTAWCVGIIARLSPVKGIDVLIKALPQILKSVPDAHVIIAGLGPSEAALRSLVEHMKINEHVHFLGTVNQTQALLPAFDVFVMPSRQEGLGLSVMEAMVSELPVVVSAVGGLNDLVEDGVNGRKVPSDNPELLAQAIIAMHSDPAQAQRLAQAGRARMMRDFEAKTMVEQTIKVYSDVTVRT